MHPIEPGMVWIGWITLVAVVITIATAIWVSAARVRTGIDGPAMTGDPKLERAIRVHANTLEHLLPFLALLWLCAWAWAPFPAAVCGIIWLFGRIIYAVGYYSAPGRRIAGFVIGMIALVLLTIGSAYGLIRLGIVLF